MMFFYCIFIRCQAEHICERSEVAMKVRPQAEPGSNRAKRVSSFPYVIKRPRPTAEQCERAKRVYPPKENPTQAPRPLAEVPTMRAKRAMGLAREACRGVP